jgi:S-DNA-T family DNA segregation ATPase FtsK/SpoIIIE
MSAGTRDHRYDALLPEPVEARLLDLGARSVGLLLLALTVFLWVSLITWSVNDPSLTHPAGTNTGNAAGALGAILSDLLLQLLGLGAVVCLFAPMIWGLELVYTQRVRAFRTKAVFYPLSILLLAAALSTLPVMSSWPLHHAMGGILGDLIGEIARTTIGVVTGPRLATLLAGFVLFAAGFSAMASSIGGEFWAWITAVSARLPLGAAPQSWHTIMRRDAKPAPTDAGVVSRDWAEPFPPAPRDFGDEDEEAEDMRTEGTVGAMWNRLRASFGRSETPAEQDFIGEPDEAQDDLAAPHVHSRFVDVGESSITEQFATTFDNLRTLRPGSREANEDFDDGFSDLSDVSIARRFAPENRRPAESYDDPAPLPGPAGRPAARVGRPGRKTPAASSRPPLNILSRPVGARGTSELTQAAIRATGQQLVDVLSDYGVKGEMRDVKPGPVVTLYEFEPVRGTKSARVIALADDIARSMSVMSVRVAVVPGRNVIGLELPNAKREPVLLRDMLESEIFHSSKAILPLALGKSIGGEAIVADLARMPHLLVAGTTGSGKSVGVNAMILSLLYRHTPDECRFIMIDPKMLELSVYNGIPHLLTPVVTDPHKAVAALGWAVTEMEERYKRMAALSVRNIEAFNQRVKASAERGETLTRTVQTGFDRATGQPRFETQEIDARPMPYIVVVVDEFADLMIVAGKEIEQAVQRLAQMARAAGIHLIMATQRPSVDIITGTIKANFPTRISFKVTSKIDSRTILNEQGAEQLLGQGDMLFSTGAGLITRVHGPFVSDEEVEAVSGFLKAQGEPDYVDGVTDGTCEMGGGSMGPAGRTGGEDDLYERAKEIVLRDRKASTSYIQRRMSIGYNRAADLIERMEREGLISPANSTGRREILKPAA